MADHRHDIEKYLKGELTPAEMHALERAALDDPFLADALEGADQLNTTQFSADVVELNQKITQKKRVVSPWVLRIAASIAVVFVSVMGIWFFLEQEPQQQLASDNTALQQLTDTLTAKPEVEQPAMSETKEEITQSPSLIKQKPASEKLSARKKSETLADDNPSSLASHEKAKTEEAESAVTPVEVTPTESRVADKVSTPKPASVPEGVKSIGSELESKRKEALTQAEQRGYLQSTQDAAPSSNMENVIEGYVTSAEDGSPLPGVNVMIKGSAIGTQTDVNGFYHIQSPVPNPTLLYAFMGMRSAELKVDKKEKVNVKLQEDQTALSEVVVTGYGTNRNTQSVPVTIEAAHPEIGNREFKKYLDENIRYPQEAITKKIQGRVIVEFTVNYDSTLSNFTIIRGIGSGCDEELIRTIKAGPKWVPTKSNNFFVNDKVKVRFKFELPQK